MNTSKYEKVQSWLKKNEGASMSAAFKATKVSAGTYYNQKKAAESKPPTPSKRKKRQPVLPAAIYDLEPIDPPKARVREVQEGKPEVRPGMVALMGSPEDIGVLLATIAKGVAQ